MRLKQALQIEHSYSTYSLATEEREDTDEADDGTAPKAGENADEAADEKVDATELIIELVVVR